MWGRAGAAIALVPADATESMGAVVGDHAAASVFAANPDLDLRTHRIWIDMLDLKGVASVDDINAAYRRTNNTGPRPETFDQRRAFSLLGDLLTQRGLSRARVGVDLEFMPTADFRVLEQVLPEVTWLDGSLCLRRLRAIKSAREIDRLRSAALVAEAGLVQMAQAIKPGVSAAALSSTWKEGMRAFASERAIPLTGSWDFISVGGDLADMSASVSPGALIKADVGALVEGYSSDGARSFTYGPPSALARDIFQALENAFARGLEQLRPGNNFGSVHDVMLQSMRRDGFSEYFRGHFGHSVGGAVGIEEWPFFAAGNPEVIQPNMVVALEAPFYGQGLGALMIEEQFLITQTGPERMTTLPWTLRDMAAETC
jgi:Xaa-Pro aminopeptidase